MEAVAFDAVGAAALAEGLADAGLAATGDTHDDQGLEGGCMEHLKRETALSLRPGKIARAWLRLLVVVVCRIPRGQWRTGRLRRLPRSRDSATLVPGILFGKQATMSITKNDKNTRTTGRPTLNEVARRAGVSPITASRALRGVASVAEELAQKVRDAARELGYVANPRRARWPRRKATAWRCWCRRWPTCCSSRPSRRSTRYCGRRAWKC